jgi:hypothetical protein
MKTSYLVKRQIRFQADNIDLRSGDILVHDPANQNKLTVYRNQVHIATLTQTPAGLKGMINQKPDPWIEQIVTPEPVVVVERPEAPVKEAAPVAPVVEEPIVEKEVPQEEKTEETPVVAEPAVKLANLNKADLITHAKEVHGLDLDPALTRKDLITAIEEKQAAQ